MGVEGTYLKIVPAEKTCTKVPQKGNIPGKGTNTKCILFSDFFFEKRLMVRGNKVL